MELYQSSTKNLLRICIPLMLSALSSNLMVFLDRLMISHYDIDAMNAVVASGSMIFLFQFAFVSIASITEVFVGQFYGAKNYANVAKPAWQMLVFSFCTIFICLPVAYNGEYLLHPAYHEHGLPFFRVLMSFVFVFTAHMAISGFFVGINKVGIITVTAVIGNLVNLGLDYLLIFGVEGYIEPMGTFGAALGTAIAGCIQFLMIFLFFLSDEYAGLYATRIFKFDSYIFLQSIRIGLPTALSIIFETSAWLTVIYILTSTHPEYITPLTLGATIFHLMTFLLAGLEKSVLAIASNLIGARQEYLMRRLFFAALRLHLIFSIILAVPILFFSEQIVSLFISSSDELTLSIPIIAGVLKWVYLYYVLDGVIWIICGIFISGGDTRFIMATRTVSIWITIAIPFYIMATYFSVGPYTGWIISCIYGIINLVLFLHRFFRGNWLKFKVNDEVNVL